MFRLMKGARGASVGMLVLTGLLGSAQAADIWVSGTGDDENGLGTSGSPFRTITTAMEEADPGDTIKVLTGDYDVDAGEIFPIQVKDGVQILGQESSSTSYPRVGGDVGDSSVRALIEVVANTANGDLDGIVLRKLRFVAENVAGEDAPSAVYVENADGSLVSVTLDACYIERDEMNDSSHADRASVVAVAGAAPTPNEEPADGLNLVLVGCKVVPTARGGVELGLGADAVAPDRAYTNLEVRDCEFTLTSSQTSAFAIDYLLEGFSGQTGLDATGTGKLNGNLIDSRESSSTGFSDGILLGADARYGGDISMPHTTLLVEDNDILGCDRAGLVIFCDEDSTSGANVQSWFVSRNVLADNGASGLILDFGDGQGADGGAYLHIRATSNMIVDNGSSGVLVGDADSVQGFLFLTSCTLAGNGGYGVELDSSSSPGWLEAIQNCIAWDNASGSHLGWTPGTDGTFTNNDWDGYFGSPSCTPDSDGNVDTDPDFENAAGGDYHLDSGSCLINKGTNDPESEQGDNFEFDFEGQRRILNGTTDIGADEAG
jgi:hypothetical protein